MPYSSFHCPATISMYLFKCEPNSRPNAQAHQQAYTHSSGQIHLRNERTVDVSIMECNEAILTLETYVKIQRQMGHAGGVFVAI